MIVFCCIVGNSRMNNGERRLNGIGHNERRDVIISAIKAEPACNSVQGATATPAFTASVAL